jgi:DNA-cytosine methyltransferase
MEMKKSELTHGSLFSGIGGPEIAAEIMGWKNVFHCEINPFGRKILDYWFPNSKSYEDITKTDFTEWREKINVLTGGFPCQPFSCAGQRKGAEDDRYLWPEMLRAIREIQPDWIVGENVAGILTMVQPGSETPLGREESLFGEVDRERILHRQEYVVETVCNDLEREGYSVQPVVIPACAVGAPHRRDRVFFIATVQTQGLKVCNENGKTTFYPVGLLPTPMSTDIHHAKRVKDLKNAGAKTMASRRNGSNRPNGLMDFMDFHGMLPTPTTSCHNPGTAKDRKDGSPRTSELNHLCARLIGKTSLLNPLFVAEMMGFPPDWTVLPFQSGGRNR